MKKDCYDLFEYAIPSQLSLHSLPSHRRLVSLLSLLSLPSLLSMEGPPSQPRLMSLFSLLSLSRLLFL